MFDGIVEAMHRELEHIEQKLSDGKTSMSNSDLDDVDKLAHALKCLATYEAMKGNSEYGGSYDGRSYARGRSRTTGRFISRDGGSEYYPPETPDGYSRRY